MNHDKDYDRDYDREDVVNEQMLRDILQRSLDQENELMRNYLIVADRIHHDEELKHRLRNFAEGNAKRTRQLEDEIHKLT
ncbi:hypothetical protein [Brevibacillus dissolubilis]|uniref:hypothetical protein n=1 Tax=Brevibacillus dissolubilis TaxID=1844116 RepID=UPI0011166578|nr:hypothetical protein [Brevibacillus dissolubilis]